MIELFLESDKDGIVIYKYRTVSVEECSFGRISLDKRTGELEVLEKDGMGYEGSLRHAVLTIFHFYETNQYPTKREVAWY